MKTVSILFLLIICNAFKLEGQTTGTTFSYNGIFEWNANIISKNRKALQSLMPKEFSTGIQFTMNPQITGFDGKACAEFRVNQPLLYNIEHKLIVDEAYIHWDASPLFSLSAGKRRFSYSYSYFWTPVFPQNKKKYIFEPDRNFEGIPLAVASVNVPYVNLKALWTTGNTNSFKEFKKEDSYLGVYADIYSTFLEGFISAISRKDSDRFFGLGLRKTLGEFTLSTESSYALQRTGAMITQTTETGSTGVFLSDSKKDSWILSASINRPFLSTGLFSIEYLHDQGGYSKNEFKNFSQQIIFADSMKRSLLPTDQRQAVYNSLISASASLYQPGFMQKDYLYCSINKKFTHVSLGLRGVICLNDTSGFVFPTIQLFPSEHVVLSLDGYIPVWENLSQEFGLSGLNGSATFRMKYFF